MHDLISPGTTGWDLAPASRLPETGCCGFNGPYPSATLDKIPTKLSGEDCKRRRPDGQSLFPKFCQKLRLCIPYGRTSLCTSSTINPSVEKRRKPRLTNVQIVLRKERACSEADRGA